MRRGKDAFCQGSRKSQNTGSCPLLSPPKGLNHMAFGHAWFCIVFGYFWSVLQKSSRVYTHWYLLCSRRDVVRLKVSPTGAVSVAERPPLKEKQVASELSISPTCDRTSFVSGDKYFKKKPSDPWEWIKRVCARACARESFPVRDLAES